MLRTLLKLHSVWHQRKFVSSTTRMFSIGKASNASCFNQNEKLKIAEEIKVSPEFLQIIATGNPDDIRNLATQRTDKEFKKAMGLIRTYRGNNPLHLAAQYNTSAAIHEIIKIMGTDTNLLAVELNNSGEPPFDLLNKNINLKSNPIQFHDIASQLFLFTRSAPTSELSDLIDEEKLLSERYPHATTVLRYNLRMGIQAINKARTVIKKSCTHHSVNLYHSKVKENEWPNVRSEIRQMRWADYDSPSFFSPPTDSFERDAKHAMRYGVGNCYELSTIVYTHLKKKIFKPSCEIFSIVNGDHAFNLIGHLPGCNLNDSATWGKNAIIADAFFGDVYEVTELSKKLKAYHHIDYHWKQQFYLAPFNPSFHTIAHKPPRTAVTTTQHCAFSVKKA